MQKSFLDSIDVKMPCNESWEEMTGNAEVRFCSHCAKDVHNISAMTRAKAAKLIKDSNGKLCVRYAKNSNGELITAPSKFTQIKRRATIAAGVLSASLTLSTLANAQSETAVPKDTANQTQTDKTNKPETKQDVFTISGTVKDEDGNAASSVEITLREAATGKVRNTQSNTEGFYEFKDTAPAIYEITVLRPFYEKLEIKGTEIRENVKRDFVLKRDISSLLPMMGYVMLKPKESKMSKIIKAPVRLFKKLI